MVRGEVDVMRASLEIPDMNSFLRTIHRVWQDHRQHIGLVRNIFMYLDRTCLAQDTGSKIRSVIDIGLHFLRLHLDRNPAIGERAVQGALELISKERSGEIVDRQSLKSVLDMYWDIGLYRHDFEPKMLESTTTFYEIEAERLVRDCEVPQLLRHIDRRIQEEQDRASNYLNSCSERATVGIVEIQFLEKRANVIVEKGFRRLMERNAFEDLRLMFQLFKRIDALPIVCSAFKSYIEMSGSLIVCDKTKSKEMVELLLKMKQQIDAIVERSFENERSFKIAREDAFVAVINVRQNRPAELMAKFMHRQLCSNKRVPPAEIEALVERLLVLFRYLNGKDVFEAFYKEDLARRLLFDQSASLELERFVIRQLKLACGSVYTTKLEGMFKDMEMSKLIARMFEESGKGATSNGHSSMFVNMLTTGFWPTYSPSTLVVPSVVEVQRQRFDDFYTSKYSGRRLVWHHDLATCVLRAQYPRGRKELHLSMPQASTLMLFNERDRLTLNEVVAAVGLSRANMTQVMKSLCNPKMKLLRVTKKTSEGGSDSEAVFVYNAAFSAKLFRLKVGMVPTKEGKMQQRATNERVARERQYQIDAVVVRTMKTRKTLKYNMLVAECARHLKFPLDPRALKKRVESLIDRDYIERDSEDPTVYNYVS